MELKSNEFVDDISLSLADIFQVLLLDFFITLISGAGGLVYQTEDYWAHNAKFYELYSSDWPLKLTSSNVNISYYFGYYLVPALIFKFIGGVNEGVVFIWNWLGLFLGLLWLYIVLNKNKFLIIIVLCIGGLTHFVASLLRIFSLKIYNYRDFGVELWSVFENLFWAPNQAIPSLILGGIFAYILSRKLDLTTIIFPIFLSFWWAIFPSFFLSSLLLVLILSELIKKPSLLSRYLGRTSIWLSVTTAIPVLLLFLSHETYPVSGFIWTFSHDIKSVIMEYSLHIVGNLLVVILMYLYFRRGKLKSLPFFPLLVIVFFTLLFALYRSGKNNDFFAKGMMPLLVLLGVYMVYPLSFFTGFKEFKNKLQHYMGIRIVILILFITIIPVSLKVWRAVKINQFTAMLNLVEFEKKPLDGFPTIYEVLVKHWSEEEARQYVGAAESFYEKYIGTNSDFWEYTPKEKK